MDKCKIKELYTLGLEELTSGKIEKAFNLLSSAFLFRLSDLSPTLEFVLYFRYQFARYLSLKNNHYISFPEGDMVSDMIRDSYNEVCMELESGDLEYTEDERVFILSRSGPDFLCPIDSMTRCRKTKESK